MNCIEIEARITRVTCFQNALGIQCHDNMFPDKTARFSTRVIGTDMEKWKNLLKEGFFIKFRGNIAEAKEGTCGEYMIVYNPEILDVYRMIPEHIIVPDEESDTPEKGA